MPSVPRVNPANHLSRPFVTDLAMANLAGLTLTKRVFASAALWRWWARTAAAATPVNPSAGTNEVSGDWTPG